jgi:hypothetical protein
MKLFSNLVHAFSGATVRFTRHTADVLTIIRHSVSGVERSAFGFGLSPVRINTPPGGALSSPCLGDYFTFTVAALMSR